MIFSLVVSNNRNKFFIKPFIFVFTLLSANNVHYIIIVFI